MSDKSRTTWALAGTVKASIAAARISLVFIVFLRMA
jgi:hypothetical protein